MGMGIGAAMTGLRPIIEGMNMGFLLLAYNQISNNAGMLHYTSGGQFKVIYRPVAGCCMAAILAAVPVHWTSCDLQLLTVSQKCALWFAGRPSVTANCIDAEGHGHNRAVCNFQS